MSFSLYCKPIDPTEGKPISHQLKFILAEAIGKYDGSLREYWVFSSNHKTLLKAIARASQLDEVQESCKLLLDYIEEHGAIQVWIGESNDY